MNYLFSNQVNDALMQMLLCMKFVSTTINNFNFLVLILRLDVFCIFSNRQQIAIYYFHYIA